MANNRKYKDLNQKILVAGMIAAWIFLKFVYVPHLEDKRNQKVTESAKTKETKKNK